MTVVVVDVDAWVLLNCNVLVLVPTLDGMLMKSLTFMLPTCEFVDVDPMNVLAHTVVVFRCVAKALAPMEDEGSGVKNVLIGGSTFVIPPTVFVVKVVDVDVCAVLF